MRKKVEVLVATMGQSDLSLYKKMSLQCDTIIANQCGQWRYEEEKNDFGIVKMISSATVGVGINRNLALSIAEADIIVFADDDMVYYDGTLQGVIEAFAELPDADVILFSIDMTRDNSIFEQRREKNKKLHLWNALRFGACRTAIKRESLIKHNIHFSTLFGGGCQYGSGEDSLFLCDCFRVGLKVYSHSYVLGACAKDSSTWFTGYNEKYLFDKGAWIACAFPKLKQLVKWYFVWKFKGKTEYSYKEVLHNINNGIAAYRKFDKYIE